jgi:hypothetical protein
MSKIEKVLRLDKEARDIRDQMNAMTCQSLGEWEELSRLREKWRITHGLANIAAINARYQ